VSCRLLIACSGWWMGPMAALWAASRGGGWGVGDVRCLLCSAGRGCSPVPSVAQGVGCFVHWRPGQVQEALLSLTCFYLVQQQGTQLAACCAHVTLHGCVVVWWDAVGIWPDPSADCISCNVIFCSLSSAGQNVVARWCYDVWSVQCPAASTTGGHVHGLGVGELPLTPTQC
jgi:hypothetical protein